MRITLYLFVLFLSGLLTGSCQRTPVSNQEYQQKLCIDVANPGTDFLSVSKLIDSIKIIPLQNSDSFLIGGISKLYIDDSMLFLSDPGSQCIYIFDHHGQVRNKISQTGRGPGEFIHMTDFTITGDRIIIADNILDKLIVYTREGIYIKEIYYPADIEKIEYLKGDLITIFTGYETSVPDKMCLEIYDIQKETVIRNSFTIPLYAQNSSLELNSTFCRYHDTILFKTVYDNALYYITPDSLTYKYYIDFGKYTLDPAFLDSKDSGNQTQNFIQFLENGNYASNLDGFIENDEFLFFNFFYNTKLHDVYYQKNNHKPYIINTSKLPDKLQQIYTQPLYAKDNYFVFSLHSGLLGDCLELCKDCSTIRLILPDMNIETTEDTNPFIIVVYAGTSLY